MQNGNPYTTPYGYQTNLAPGMLGGMQGGMGMNPNAAMNAGIGAMNGNGSGSNFNWNNLPGGIANLIAGIFGNSNYKNPADSAMPYLNQLSNSLPGYYQPYINAGNGALNTLQGQYGNLINDPGALMAKIGGGFQQSPGYQFQVDQALGAANRAAAAGGMVGSPMEQQNIATTVNGLANQDYYNYLNHGIGLYDRGLQGEEGINQMGFNASNNLAQQMAQALATQAQLAYAGQNNENQSNGGSWGAIANGIGDLASLASIFI